MPTLELTPDTLIVRLSKVEKFFALHGDVHVPLHQVRGATEDSGFHREGLGIRLPGTDIPGVLKAGTFLNGADKQFVLLKRSLQPLVIELAGAKFARLVIGLPDARAIAARINAAVAGRHPASTVVVMPDPVQDDARRRRHAWLISATSLLLCGGTALLAWRDAGGGDAHVHIAVFLAATLIVTAMHVALVRNRAMPAPLFAALAVAAVSIVAGAVALFN